MTRQLGCLHSASSRFLAGHGVARDMHQLCKQLLAANLRCGADLGAPVEVRMVWWGFRALKTPEERPNCRRFSVGGISVVKPAQEQSKPNAIQGQLRDKTWTDSVRNECSSRAQWRAI